MIGVAGMAAEHFREPVKVEERRRLELRARDAVDEVVKAVAIGESFQA